MVWVLYRPGSTGSLVLLWGFRGSGIDLAPRGPGIGLDPGAPGIVVNLESGLTVYWYVFWV